MALFYYCGVGIKPCKARSHRLVGLVGSYSLRGRQGHRIMVSEVEASQCQGHGRSDLRDQGRDKVRAMASCRIRWRMTASLRATATVAFLSPIFLTSRVPQALSADHRETRFKTNRAASSSSSRAALKRLRVPYTADDHR